MSVNPDNLQLTDTKNNAVNLAGYAGAPLVVQIARFYG